MVSADTVVAAAAASLCVTTFMPEASVLRVPGMPEPLLLAEPLVYHIPCEDVAAPTPPTHVVPAQKYPALLVQRDDAPASTQTAQAATDSSSTGTSATAATHGNSSSNLGFGGSGQSSSPQPLPPGHISDLREPFYKTTYPIIYTLAATTVVSYMLVIMLFITPRSFVDGGMVYLGRRGSFTSGASGTSIGGRPLLQKIAALTVAISLTIATVDTMNKVHEQYYWGVQNSSELQIQVMSRTDIKVSRLISSTFLWLAQAQTLIRLFPRHRERVLIKWVAFLLITLDLIFSAVSSFKYGETVLSAKFNDSGTKPVPAVSYVFQLSLGILYAAWVMYYALMKRRYSFYHPLMKNMTLVACISILAILVPIIFFLIDLLQKDFVGWGDYVRWVGAAGASVVVWEWVERIEALEREEKKDGVLGREVFDVDDMLHINASEFPWLRRRRSRRDEKDGKDDDGGDLERQPTATANGWATLPTSTNNNDNSNHARGHNGSAHPTAEHHQHRTVADILRPPLWSRGDVATPVSRTDTPSAASTVYAVRYQGVSESTRTPEPLPMAPTSNNRSGETSVPRPATAVISRDDTANLPARRPRSTRRPTQENIDQRVSEEPEMTETQPQQDPEFIRHNGDDSLWRPSKTSRNRETDRWDVRSRLEDFAATRAERIRERFRPSTEPANLPVTVIPAPPRNGAALQQVLEEEAAAARQSSSGSSGETLDETSRAAAAAAAAAPTASSSSSSSPGSRNRMAPLPINNPPLWPGVRRQPTQEDWMSVDGDSTTHDGSSVSDERSRH